MTIKKAISELMASEPFLEDSRKDAKLRVFKQRYNEGKIKNGAAVGILLHYGYKVEVTGKGKRFA